MSDSVIARVTARVPAKINVVLAVGPRRPDGFHDLATVFHAVSLWDEVTATAADDFTIEITGEHIAGVPADESNLALRAARILAERANVNRGVHLRVHKEIPVAAGLAGGSADAAGALLACAALWDVHLPDEDMAEIAAQAGSDVPFALQGGTAIGEGRGERLRYVAGGGRLHWVIMAAGEGLSTPEIYRRFDNLSGGHDAREGASVPALPATAVDAVRSGDPKAVAAVMRNDLQAAALEVLPGLAVTLDAGIECGALAGIVSGSGPTCVFLARDAAHAETLAADLRRLGASEQAVPVHGPVTTDVVRG